MIGWERQSEQQNENYWLMPASDREYLSGAKTIWPIRVVELGETYLGRILS